LNEIRIGDCREIMKALIADGVKVQTCITSPPYFGLRDYGTASWEGGSVECDHRAPNERRQLPHGDGRLNDSYADERHLIPGAGALYRGMCGKCGATRVDQQLGLEKTPAEYVDSLVEVFRLVRRLLADDGTLWLNLGDSYANDGKWCGHTGGKHAKVLHCSPIGRNKRYTGLKQKDLMGIPWRVAFALQSDGWYLRSDIIWHKPNPMPESVVDRPTKSHEYIFLLSKCADYFWDQEAVSEPKAASTRSDSRGNGNGNGNGHRSDRDYPGQQNNGGTNLGGSDGSRNIRSVWTVATQPYAGAHFAAFPTKLIEPCILAGSRRGDIVLDPFMGSGTTAFVAKELGRRYLGCELNPEYRKLQDERLAQEVLFSAEVNACG
jgi:DNA modification methylase